MNMPLTTVNEHMTMLGGSHDKNID